MTAKTRTIQIDAETAAALEGEAEARGITLSELLEKLARENTVALPGNMETLRQAGRGPWSPQAMAEDARAFADYERTGEGVPFDEVATWMRSWGTPSELPVPKPRKL